jgi:hypothetical protein
MNIPYTYVGTNNEMHLFRLKLNHKTAKLLLENHKNPRNRTLKEDKVKQYARDMENNNWEENGESIIFDENFVLTNGHHRLAALSKTNSLDKELLFTFGVAENVNAYDVGTTRSIKDTLVMVGDTDLAKYSAYITTIGYLEENNGDFGGTRSNAEKIRTCNKFKEEIFKYKDLFNELKYVPFWASMIWISKKYPNEVEQFIDNVISGAGLNVDSPELILSKFLSKKQSKSSSGDRKDIAMITLHCFNRFIKNETMSKTSRKCFERTAYDELKK